jgi:hypothetical protein
MEVKYENELNNSLINFVSNLIMLDSQMKEMGTLINQKASIYDTSYISPFYHINHISVKLIDSYNRIFEASNECNLCVTRLRNMSDKNSFRASHIVEEYPSTIKDFTTTIINHVKYVKSIIQCISNWKGDLKAPDCIVNIDKAIFEYTNSLEDSIWYFSKINESINSFVDHYS